MSEASRNDRGGSERTTTMKAESNVDKNLDYWDNLENIVLKISFKDFDDEDKLKAQEEKILELGERYKSTGKREKMRQLIKKVWGMIKYMNKAKAAKLVRQLVNQFLDMKNGDKDAKIQLCNECIEWAESEKRTFLRQALEVRLVGLLYEVGHFDEGIVLVEKLKRELKIVDDKDLLLEVQLWESRLFFSLKNVTKSEAALASAKTTANGIYVNPMLQALLDLQSGILHATNGDFGMAFSYFFEAYTQSTLAGEVDDSVILDAFKYALLCKIKVNDHDGFASVLHGKNAANLVTKPIVKALVEIAEARKGRSLGDFKTVMKKFDCQLASDRFMIERLNELYEVLLEENICRITEPYSKVDCSFIAEKINLKEKAVEEKLSKMILDKKIYGILDQEKKALIIYDPDDESGSWFPPVLELVGTASKSVDKLYSKSKKLS